MALFAVYYRLTPQAARGWLLRVHAVAAIVGVALMVPCIAVASTGGSPGLAIVGSLLMCASMLIFLVTMIRYGFGAEQTGACHSLSRGALSPAE